MKRDACELYFDIMINNLGCICINVCRICRLNKVEA